MHGDDCGNGAPLMAFSEFSGLWLSVGIGPCCGKVTDISPGFVNGLTTPIGGFPFGCIGPDGGC